MIFCCWHQKGCVYSNQTLHYSLHWINNRFTRKKDRRTLWPRKSILWNGFVDGDTVKHNKNLKDKNIFGVSTAMCEIWVYTGKPKAQISVWIHPERKPTLTNKMCRFLSPTDENPPRGSAATHLPEGTTLLRRTLCSVSRALSDEDWQGDLYFWPDYVSGERQACFHTEKRTVSPFLRAESTSYDLWTNRVCSHPCFCYSPSIQFTFPHLQTSKAWKVPVWSFFIVSARKAR